MGLGSLLHVRKVRLREGSGVHWTAAKDQRGPVGVGGAVAREEERDDDRNTRTALLPQPYFDC